MAESEASSGSHRRRLVAHIVFRFDIGGLETVLVNVINTMNRDRYRHCIICLTTHTKFRLRIDRDDVELFSLGKQPGKDPAAYLRLWRMLRRLGPDVVHTYNIAAIDCAPVAALAGVPVRIHAEHGRDVWDLHGTRAKYIWMRRVMALFIHRFVPVSRELEHWLQGRVGLSARKVTRICNGVDADRFHPPLGVRERLPVEGFSAPEQFVIGCVGRIDAVKDHATLLRAFAHLVETVPSGAKKLRLAILGDGPELADIRRLATDIGVDSIVWLPGAREDVADLVRGFDVFVLSSLVEGIALTLLEAMACARPVVVTRVGGNPELVVDGVNGRLVPVSDPVALAAALRDYLENPDLAHRHGTAGRERVEREFSIGAMVSAYLHLYDHLCH